MCVVRGGFISVTGDIHTREQHPQAMEAAIRQNLSGMPVGELKRVMDEMMVGSQSQSIFRAFRVDCDAMAVAP